MTDTMNMIKAAFDAGMKRLVLIGRETTPNQLLKTPCEAQSHERRESRDLWSNSRCNSGDGGQKFRKSPRLSVRAPRQDD